MIAAKTSSYCCDKKGEKVFSLDYAEFEKGPGCYLAKGIDKIIRKMRIYYQVSPSKLLYKQFKPQRWDIRLVNKKIFRELIPMLRENKEKHELYFLRKDGKIKNIGPNYVAYKHFGNFSFVRHKSYTVTLQNYRKRKVISSP